MKLNYRGVSYEYTPPVVAVEEDQIAGRFRGLDWRFHNLKKPLVLQPGVNLTYRGVTYNNRPNTTVEKAPTETKVQESARWLMLQKGKAAKRRAASMLSRTAHEIGLA
ncbi:MAG: DUF4278 domain-containing protein [Pleurocapsa sp.]